MSVTLPNRSVSDAEFIHETYLLNVKIGSAFAKMNQKYRPSYGQKMVESGLNALKYLHTGNGIYVDKNTPKLLFETRLKYFNIARGIIYNIPTIFYIYVHVRINSENPKQTVKEKWFEQGKAMTDYCNKIVSLISGVIKSDKRRYKEYMNKSDKK